MIRLKIVSVLMVGAVGLVVTMLLAFSGWSVLAASEVAVQPSQPLVAAPQVMTQTVAVLAMKDNTLYEDETGSLSNGMGSHFFVGSTASGALRRGVIAFDVAGALPEGATIISATLDLHMSKKRDGAPEQTAVSVYTLQKSWGEGESDAASNEGGGTAASLDDATWLHTFFDADLWTQPGGDFDDIPLATTMVGGNGRYQWNTTELTDDVAAWYHTPNSNFGWILLGDEATIGSARRFDSRQHPLEANQPRLMITYTAPDPEHILYLPITQRQ